MTFLSLEPFVPTGSNFEGARQFFQEVGFTINWDAGDYIGFERDGCKFILQKYDQPDFAQNFMLTVRVSNIQEFWQEMTDKQLTGKYRVKIGKPSQQPYGKEVNVIDMAGVCWHFVE